jgi:hypothetical protein
MAVAQDSRLRFRLRFGGQFLAKGTEGPVNPEQLAKQMTETMEGPEARDR